MLRPDRKQEYHMTMHEGHRSRMRERFRKEGLEGFAPHEALELLLFYARARGDVNPLAHDLLENFGSIKGVLEARPEQLMAVKGVGEETATLLSMIVPLFRKYQECVCAERKVLRNRVAAEGYCAALLAGLRTERFYVISLSSAMSVLGQRAVGEGSLNEVPAYPRLVVETALNYNAFGVVLCHNHPGGVAEPSPDDVAVTQNVEAVLRHLGIRLIDHIIIAGSAAYSMSLNGHLAATGVRTQIDGKRCREDEQEYVWLDERKLD